MRSLSRGFALLGALFVASSAWAINKCTGPDGSVSYQEAPCSGSAKGQELKVQKEPEAQPIQAAYSNAIAQGKIMIGMTAEQARRAWGSPSKVNRTVTAYSATEQWVYDHGNYRSSYIYLEDGKVRSWQTP